jgi:putative membrane protein
MTATQNELAGLSRFIFRTPRWYVSVAFALLIAATTGVAAFDSGDVDSWRGLLFLGRDAWEGIFFIGVPTVVAGLGTAGVDRALGGRLTANRSSLLALVCELLTVVLVVAAGVVAAVSPSLGQRFVFDVLVVALASVFAFRLLVIVAVSRHRLLVAAVPAGVQTLAFAVLLFVYSGTLRYLEVGGPLLSAYLFPYLARAEEAPPALTVVSPDHFLLLAATCVVYAGGVWVFLYVVDRPWRRSLGVSVLDFLRGFIGHVAEGSRELEDFFEELGQEAVVPVHVLSFRRDDGGEKARFVLPMIHPGPMGEIGGGNFPERLARRSEGLAFPPHATAGHDFNLVTEREVDTILDAADAALDEVTYTDDATVSVRERAGDASVLGQGFGDDALLVNTFSPGFADDVEYAVGLSAATEARTAGLDDVLLVDAHNCNNGLEGPDLGHVTPGSQRSFDMITAAGDAGAALADAERGSLSLGVAWDETPWEPRDGIGPLGVRVAVTAVAGETTAYVLVDGNNMEPGLRDHLVEALTGRDPTAPDEGRATGPDAAPDPAIRADGSVVVDRAEVLTTDTHIVNTVEADNQVGAAIDDDELVSLVRDLVGEALGDREPVTAGVAAEHAEVTVFGNDRTETLASHANAVVAMGGAFALAVIATALAVSVLLFLLA